MVTGALASPIDIRDYRIKVSETCEFPDEFELDMPPVKNQGMVSSCVANSVATVIEYFSRLQGDEDREFSVGYIYGNRMNTPGSIGKGMQVRGAIENAMDFGDVVKTLFPEEVDPPEAIELFQDKYLKLFPKAYPFRISSYYACKTNEEIKTALMKKSPVIFSMKWKDSNFVLGDTIQLSEAEEKNAGYHCMVIYGWNKDGWKIQNSWGKLWGNKGRAILPYKASIYEAYGVTDEISENMRSKRLKDLESQNAEIKKSLTFITQERDNLIELLRISTDNETSDSEKIRSLNEKLHDLNETIYELNEAVKDKEKIIDNLTNELVELKKPFQSGIGKVFAKIINFFCNLFRKK